MQVDSVTYHHTIVYKHIDKLSPYFHVTEAGRPFFAEGLVSNKTLSKPALLGCLRRPLDAILTAVPSKWRNRNPSECQGTCTQNRGSIGIWLNTFTLHLLRTFRNVVLKILTLSASHESLSSTTFQAESIFLAAVSCDTWKGLKLTHIDTALHAKQKSATAEGYLIENAPQESGHRATTAHINIILKSRSLMMEL